MAKILLTTEQSVKLYNLTLTEMTKNTLDEGIWDTVKYGLSKLGRYKAGGKITGKAGVDQDAVEKVKAIIDKKGNDLIAGLNSKIKEENPQFPNSKRESDFLRTVLDISEIYDSIVAATKKSPNEEGHLPIDAANGLINDLRAYVKKFLDVDLKAIYSVVDEADNIAGIVRKNLQAKRGQGDDFQSDRMSTLKSNKLPLILSAIGTSLGAFGWLTNTDWFKSLFETITPDTATETITQKTAIFTDIKDGEGVYKLLGRVTNHPLDGNSSPSEMIEALKQIGGGDANKGIDLLCQKGGVMMNPEDASRGLHDLVNNPNKYQNMGEFFQSGTETSGTGKLSPTNTTLYGTIAGSKLTSILLKVIPGALIKGGVTMGAGYAAAKGLGSLLGPLGIGLLGAGALVKLMRMKGQRQSRAKTLNDLYQSIRNLDGGVGIVDGQDSSDAQNPNDGVDSTNSSDPVARGTNGSTSSVSSDEIYNQLKKLFQTIVNDKKRLGVRAADNVGTGMANQKGRMKVGDTYDYNGLPVTILNTNIGDGRVQVQSTGKAKNKFTVKPETLSRMNEGVLSEGKFITDKRLIQFLEKNLSYDKLKSFEDFMTRVEYIRNLVKKLDVSQDKVLKGFVDRYNTNPIMLTDFKKLFNVSSENAQAVNSLKAFIDDLYVTLYSGKYKFNSMIDKMATLGGGNVNKLEEAGYVNQQKSGSFEKDAQDRRTFKKNLVSFLENSIGLFQYLYKLKTQGPSKPKQPNTGGMN